MDITKELDDIQSMLHKIDPERDTSEDAVIKIKAILQRLVATLTQGWKG